MRHSPAELNNDPFRLGSNARSSFGGFRPLAGRPLPPVFRRPAGFIITSPELAAEALGSFLAADMKDRRSSRSNASATATPSITTSSTLCSSPWPVTTSSKGARC